ARQRSVLRPGPPNAGGGGADLSGFPRLTGDVGGGAAGEAAVQLILALVLIGLALWAWRWAAQEGSYRFSVRHVGGLLVGLAAAVLAIFLLFTLRDLALRQNQWLARSLSFLAPVQQSQ